MRGEPCRYLREGIPSKESRQSPEGRGRLGMGKEQQGGHVTEVEWDSRKEEEMKLGQRC